MSDGGLLKDVTDSVKASLYERVTSPLLGTLTAVWLVENWKILLIIFSGEGSVYLRIAYIQNNLLDGWSIAWRPLIVSSIILLLYPFISLLPLVIWEFGKSIRIRIRNYFELETPLTIEQSRNLRQELHNLTRKQLEYEELVSKANDLLTRQKTLISQAEQSQPAAHQDKSLKEALRNIDMLQKDIAELKKGELDIVTGQPTVSDPARYWTAEIEALLSGSSEFVPAMDSLLGLVPDRLDNLHPSFSQFLISLGLLTRNQYATPQQVTLTQKGAFMVEQYALLRTTGQLKRYQQGH